MSFKEQLYSDLREADPDFDHYDTLDELIDNTKKLTNRNMVAYYSIIDYKNQVIIMQVEKYIYDFNPEDLWTNKTIKKHTSRIRLSLDILGHTLNKKSLI